MQLAPFYSAIRPFFGGSLTIDQVKNMDALIFEFARLQIGDVRQLAYVLATVHLETDGTMAPIEEYSKGRGKAYGSKFKYGKGPGKRVAYLSPDKIYFGRGHTQNTWWENYDALTKAAKKQGKNWDFLNNPELLLEIEPSIWATWYAMTTGLYTGRRLNQYFNAKIEDPIKARQIINGLDKAKIIANKYYKFLKALKGVDNYLVFT